MSDFIDVCPPKREDRVIRKLYTPKEVVKKLEMYFSFYSQWSELNRGEKLIILEFINGLIWEFKDD